MSSIVSVEPLGDARGATCRRILEALPQWFGLPEAIDDYVSQVKSRPCFVARDGDDVVGFASTEIHGNWSVEVHVMGVLPSHHRRGIGRALLHPIEDLARGQRIPLLTVKTLGPSRQDEPYSRTRTFYERCGFRPVMEVDLWGPSNPCLIMVKPLTASGARQDESGSVP